MMRAIGAAVCDSPTDDGERPVAPGVLDELVGYRLRRASSLFAHDFARVSAGTGMRQVLFGILAIVAGDPGISQGRVGRALGIQRANMVSLVNELVARGLVRRDAAMGDRRAFALSLTDRGATVMVDALRRIRRHEAELLAGLSAEERATLIALLGRIVAADR